MPRMQHEKCRLIVNPNIATKYITEIHMIEHISFGDQVLGIIVRRSFCQPGVHFFTRDDFSQQLAYMNHPAGKVIAPHVHNSVTREVFFTQEVLLIKRGKVRIDFYDDNQNYHESRILEAGDVILLASGGHGFEALEEIEMIEVKQGPYAGEHDKTRFAAVDCAKLMVKTGRDDTV